MVFHNSLEELRVHEGGFAKYPKHLLCHPTLVLQNSGLSATTSSATFVALGTNPHPRRSNYRLLSGYHRLGTELSAPHLTTTARPCRGTCMLVGRLGT